MEVAKMLIQREADVNSTNNDEQTPLHYATRNNAADVAELLLNETVDVNAQDKCRG